MPAQETLYLARSGENIDESITLLSQEPAMPLSPEAKAEVLAFESELLNGKLGIDDGRQLQVEHAEDKTLPEIVHGYKYKNRRHEITADFLLTDAGLELLGEHRPANPLNDTQEAAGFIRSQALVMDAATLKTIAKQSEAFASENIKQALLEGQEIADPTRVFVFEDVTQLLQRASSLLAYRKFYGEVQRTIGEDMSQTGQAKRLVTEIYQKFVNAEIASAYPDVLHLWAQAEAMPDAQKQIIQGAIEHIHQPFVTLGKRFMEEVRPSSVVRLDRLRNGASFGPDGFSPVANELKQLFESGALERPIEPALLSEEQLARLDSVRFNADQLKEYCELVLERFGKLSDNKDEQYDPDRPDRTSDGKWQVYVTDKVSSLDVEDPPGYVRVPANFNRTLTAISPAGVIPVVAHELSHVFQKDNIRNGEGLQISTVLGGGKRKGVMQETGAIMIEREIQRRLFGRDRNDNPHYMRAMLAIEEGGGEIAAIKACYESFREASPGTSPESAATDAISRVKRLVRRQGGYDSQALNYAETALLAAKTEHLPEPTKAILFAEGAYDLIDLARLHQYGLTTEHPEAFPIDDYIAIVTDIFKKVIEGEE